MFRVKRPSSPRFSVCMCYYPFFYRCILIWASSCFRTATVWMRSPMTRTWTWFRPKPWGRLCAAARRVRPARCSDSGAVNRTFGFNSCPWLLSLAPEALFLTQDQCCAAWRNSVTTEWLLIMQDCVHQGDSTHMTWEQALSTVTPKFDLFFSSFYRIA